MATVKGQVFTLPEVAEACRVSIRTVRKWIASGRLACVHVGRRYTVTQEAIDEMRSRYGRPAVELSARPTPPPELRRGDSSPPPP